MKTALISVSDKTGVVDFARKLFDLGYQIISTGNTSKALEAAQVPRIEVSAWTNSDESRDGLVKTLHPKIYKSILLGENDPVLIKEGIDPIKLVVCNLYDFEDDKTIDKVDIGGPSMISAAFKGWHLHGGVIPVVNPNQYDAIIEALQTGGISKELGDDLAAEAMSYVAYDRAVVAGTYQKKKFPKHMTIPLRDSGIKIRYGENPHQSGGAYLNPLEANTGGILDAKQLSGIELSYNNIIDLDSALRLTRAIDGMSQGDPVCTIIKHNNACGAAIGKTLNDAYDKAFRADMTSAFGGIVSVNHEFDEQTAHEMVVSNKHFVECVIAPSYSAAALQILETKGKVRVIQSAAASNIQKLSVKSINGGMLVQDYNNTFSLDDPAAKIKMGPRTDRSPTAKEMASMDFNWRVCCLTKSNTITFAMDRQLVGVGTGQQNRIDCVELAIERALKMAKEGYLPKSGVLTMASDSFFPFDDCMIRFVEFVRELEGAGYKLTGKGVIYNGGGIRDSDSIKVANQNDIVMYHAGVRGFCH
ncbi:MAG: bifunctional phosphoribosylaminoimidazolecarboxamide formyltransferase/IMP cyclohydrolase [Proteobacteria bacterium]|nr:bifunctional phosphoribosylaminoimidazolecarboxamide formyltransferase/IMP cyclohydrolase [Pseudomonadota bacterium]